MSLASAVWPAPASDADGARALFAKLAARDGPEISAAGRSRLYDPGNRAKRAVVLIHGFTNCPEQWMVFAQTLADDGCAVVIPRLPGHGYADRATRAIGGVTARQMLVTASAAVDVAAGLADEVIVAGLSIGGAIATWLAIHRQDVARAIAIVPMFGLIRVSAPWNAVVAAVLTALPDIFMPWDPSGKNASIPPYAYTHFPTHVLAESMTMGLATYDDAFEHGTRGDVRFLLNAHEPAINNDLAQAVAARLERDRPGSARTFTFTDLPKNHDIIDPTNPNARLDIVYPRVRAEIEN